ncbi:MAG: hypothetical protein JSR60_15925 [Proteobacteria bacterium]|nr:hypothetical protein [Pseudomonadota bacterium]
MRIANIALWLLAILAATTSASAAPPCMRIHIARGGAVSVDGQEVPDKNALAAKLTLLRKRWPACIPAATADPGTKPEDMRPFIAAMRAAGFEKFGILLEPGRV